TIWVSGIQGYYLYWTGTCAAMGNTTKVQLITDPTNAVVFVADMGTIDCSSATNNSAPITVPGANRGVAPGTYTLQILTLPQSPYSATFQIGGSPCRLYPACNKTHHNYTRHHHHSLYYYHLYPCPCS
ncbi:hypothetical protein BGX26_004102, partial [Mortierella sp. AD094]